MLGWQYENQYLRRHIAQRARFEDITSSYRLFCLQILEPLGIKLDETVWKAAVRCPENVTENDMVGTWDDWPRDQQHQFLRICGTEMKEYGYEIPEIDLRYSKLETQYKPS